MKRILVRSTPYCVASETNVTYFCVSVSSLIELICLPLRVRFNEVIELILAVYSSKP